MTMIAAYSHSDPMMMFCRSFGGSEGGGVTPVGQARYDYFQAFGVGVPERHKHDVEAMEKAVETDTPL